MSDMAQEITRAATAGVQKEQPPPKFKERVGVAQARRHVEHANKHPKTP